VVRILSVKKLPLNAGRDVVYTLRFYFGYRFLMNAGVFVVPTTRVLAVVNVRFTVRVRVRVIIILACTTSIATMGLYLARNAVEFRVIMAATTLSIAFAGDGWRGVSFLLVVTLVYRTHSGVPGVVVGMKKERPGRAPPESESS
jgi:hypothetical protein